MYPKFEFPRQSVLCKRRADRQTLLGLLGNDQSQFPDRSD